MAKRTPVDLKVDYNDRLYTFMLSKMDVVDAMGVEEYTGTKPLRLVQNAIQDPLELGTKDLQALYWLMVRQNGEHPRIHEIDIDIYEFAEALTEAVNEFATASLEARKAETAERAKTGRPPKARRELTPGGSET